MQIAGIRSALSGRTIRPDTTTDRTAEPAATREAIAAARAAATAPLPPSPARTSTLRPVVVAFPSGEEQKIATPRAANDALRAYGEMQAPASRPVLSLVEDIAESAAPARTTRPARVAASADEALPDAPRPTQTAAPGLQGIMQSAAHGLSALLRLVPGQAATTDRTPGRKPAKATAERQAENADAATDQGGWTEAITLLTLVATVALALWLLVF